VTGTPPRLNAIKTRHDLAKAIGVPVKYLIRRAFEIDQKHLYSEFIVPKRSGGDRVIHAPYWPTANTQKRIRELLEEIYRPSNRVMGFVKERGIRDNAKFHVGKRLVLNIDLADYFGSIHFGRIRRRLMARPYALTNDVATIIAKLCTLDGRLPTGASTSPILANIVSSAMDGALAEFAKQRGCFYTRYADDLTFSTNRSVFPSSLVRRSHEAVSGVEAAPELTEIITTQGFSIQPGKTRLMTKHMRQEVCGVTCNERLNVRRTLYRDVRATLNAWRKHGRKEAEAKWHEKYNWRSALSLERSLRGRIEHIIHIRGHNDKAVYNLVCQFNELQDRSFKGITYEYLDNDPLGIHESVCLIQCDDEPNLTWSQGSGFVVEGGAIITNHHVISYFAYQEHVVEKNGKPTKISVRATGEDGKVLPPVVFPHIRVSFDGSEVEYDVEVVYSDPKRDLAVLRPSNPLWAKAISHRACQLSFTSPQTGSEVSLVGFPSHSPGGSCKVVPGFVTGTTPLDGNPYFTISQIIVQGNSGGPVVDKFGQVIGIATKGVSPNEELNLAFNGCIPIHTLDKAIFALT
jgi:RNA-directed DNA polymerase